ncbi:hypothetical protein [Streptomyces sp. NPDC051636]|uniref:hypothetical protein n=1 Tax=Streptomyces sp. NPDC051636 TaxID=3365663 RepID=UPI0037A903C6
MNITTRTARVFTLAGVALATALGTARATVPVPADTEDVELKEAGHPDLGED